MDAKCLNSKLHRETISKTIIERITDALISGELKPGDRLPTDTELSQMLGVGRNSVREALKIMEAFGILEIKRAEGIYIRKGYTDGMVDPLLYGVILDGGEREGAGKLRECYLQTLLLLDVDLVTEKDLDELRRLLQKVEDAVYQERKVCSIYKAILPMETYLANISGNAMAARTYSVLEKICRTARRGELESLIEHKREEEVAIVYRKIVKMLETKNKAEVITIFEIS